jgi:hypothetical protein
MSAAEASQPHLKSELVLRFRAELMFSCNLLCHVERKPRYLLLFSCKIRDSSTPLGMTEKQSARENCRAFVPDAEFQDGRLRDTLQPPAHRGSGCSALAKA